MGWGYGRGWGYGPGWGYRGGCLPFGGCFPFFLLALLPLVAFSLARLGRRHRSPRGD
jgi:hypothetical protein